ncbi:hypothetical protein ACWGIU_22275 [Streptomyces sp. NPDC054840]
MDYRNADGSLGQMCGNGIRVLARYLVDARHCPAGTSWPSPPAPAYARSMSRSAPTTSTGR